MGSGLAWRTTVGLGLTCKEQFLVSAHPVDCNLVLHVRGWGVCPSHCRRPVWGPGPLCFLSWTTQILTATKSEGGELTGLPGFLQPRGC